MADAKISELAELTSLADGDEFVVVDKSDTTMAASGTDKRVTKETLDDTYAAASHTHAEADVTGLTAALAAKQDASSAATDAELATGLATKANTSHTHAIADTTGLQAAIDAKQDASSAATDSELSTHAVDTTSVHGIDDTSVLATATSVATAVSNHESDTSVHGIADTTALATDTEVATAISQAISNLINGAPGALDTLDELAAALGDDAAFATTVTNALAGKQPLDSDLTAIAALSTTATGRSLLAAADAAAIRAIAGAETSGAAAAAQAASQPLDADLTAIGGLSPSNDDIVQRKSGAWTNRTPAQVKTDLALAKGDVGLGNVDNTSDASKPVSTATQTALDAKQPLDSDLTALAALSTTAFGRAFLELANAAAGRTALGLGTASLSDTEPSLPSGWVAPIGAVSPFVSTASTAPGANNARLVRMVVPRAGTISSLTWYVGVSNGNYKALIFDTGQASAGNYTVLYASASTAVGTVDTWQTPLNPALAVTAGQQIMVGLVFDGGTGTFGRNVAPGSAAMASIPATMGPSPGSVVRAAMAGTVTFASPAASYSDASMAGLTAGPTMLIKVT